MTSRDFCYWLQGYFEIEGNQPRHPEYVPSLNYEQIKMIRNHLAMVFKHEIDPSFKASFVIGSSEDKKHQDALAKLHDGFDPTTTKFNC